MKAYKCDICGGFYTDISSNTVKKHQVRLGNNSTYVDYCPTCVGLIQQVIDERSNPNIPKEEVTDE